MPMSAENEFPAQVENETRSAFGSEYPQSFRIRRPAGSSLWLKRNARRNPAGYRHWKDYVSRFEAMAG